MGTTTGNPAWQNYPIQSTPLSAEALNKIETAIDAVANKEYESASGSLMVANYMAAGATPGQNTARMNDAVTDAAALGVSLCFDGVYVEVAGQIDLLYPGQRVWASTPAACILTQTQALNSQGIFRVSANGVQIDGFTLNSTLTVNGLGLLDLTGMIGDVHHISAIKVDPGVEDLTIDRVKGRGWFIGLTGFQYNIGTENSSLPAGWNYIKRLRVSNLDFTDVWGVVRMSGLNDAEYSNVYGSYRAVTGAPEHVNSAPPHLFYISMPTDGAANAPKGMNYNVRIRDCHARGGVGGAPYSLRYTEGMTISNLTADNCEGLIDMILVKNFTVSGAHGTNDIYPKVNDWNGNRGSMSFFWCEDGQIDPFLIESKKQFAHGSIFYVAVSKNLNFLYPKGSIDLAVAETGWRAAYISGTNINVIRPELTSTGADMALAYQLATGFDGVSTPNLEDPRSYGNFLRGIDDIATTTRKKISYDPEKLTAKNQAILISNAATVAPIIENLALGYPPKTDPRIVAWHLGEKLGDGGSIRLRWGSGHVAAVHTDCMVATTTPGVIASNGTVSGIDAVPIGTPNVEVESIITHGAGAIGIALRVIDAQNFISISVTATQVVLGKIDLNVATDFGARYTLPEAGSGIEHKIRARIVGNLIRVWVDDVLTHTYTLAGADATKFVTSNHGVRSSSAGATSLWRGIFIRKV